MDSDTNATARKLAQSLMRFNKTFMQFHRSELHQNFTGCKPSEVGVLFAIRHGVQGNGRPIKVSEISKHMHVTSPTITQLLNSLEANGLVERHTDPTDRRAVGIALTEHGEQLAQKAENILFETFQDLSEYLGDQQSNQLADLLIKAFQYFNERDTNGYFFPWKGEEA